MLLSKLQYTVLLVALAVAGGSAASSDDKKSKPPPDPCTIASAGGSFFDLRPLSINLEEELMKPAKSRRIDSWHAKGYDYKSNFTLNICAPVVERVHDVQGVEKNLWRNISAYYEVGSKQYSLGQASSELVLRGKRLVLQYANGSPCGESKHLKRSLSSSWKDDDDDEDEEEDEPSVGKGDRRKSATISFHCDKDPLATGAIASFASVDPDECAYFFEVLSPTACGGAAPAKEGLGPASVFAIIGVIAVLVYFLGGVVYQRNVAHARGWRQLPNYTMWAGIWNFITDFLIIVTSSCVRLLPGRRGYSALAASGNSGVRGRHRPDDENRLIDQLDEEWDD